MLTCTRWLKSESGPHSLPGWYAAPLVSSSALSTLLDGSLGRQGAAGRPSGGQVPEELLPRLRSWGLDGSPGLRSCPLWGRAEGP